MVSEFLTTREKIFFLLEETDKPLTARQIKEILHLDSEKDVYEHLRHVALSAKRKGYKLVVQYPMCSNCGFVFDDKLAKPSRCPRCGSTKIAPPRFLIRRSSL
jgi:predicted Zn-ribbon and HTH transcriptional regulator